MKTLAIILSILAGYPGPAASVPAAPVPISPYIPLIYRYADTLLDHGRETNGAFFTVLDRHTFKPRASTNFYDQQNFLRLLYTLTELSTKPKYRDAADAALGAFLRSNPTDYSRPWVLWSRCFDVAPEPSTQFALRLIKTQTTNHPGFCVRTWSAAYGRTTNELFLGAIERLASAFDPKMTLSLAIDCDGSTRFLPEPLASRLRTVASREDDVVCTAALGIQKPLWTKPSAAQTGMMFVSRYENTGRIGYRDLMHAAANAYLKSSPPEDQDLWPVTLGQAISLQLAAWRSTASQAHLDKARELGDFAIAKFFDGSPLPRAQLKNDDYDASTGADSLALALTELHLHVLYITAVRCPSNTIDR